MTYYNALLIREVDEGGLKRAPSLSRDHIHLDRSSKMNVRIAAQASDTCFKNIE